MLSPSVIWPSPTQHWSNSAEAESNSPNTWSRSTKHFRKKTNTQMRPNLSRCGRSHTHHGTESGPHSSGEGGRSGHCTHVRSPYAACRCPIRGRHIPRARNAMRCGSRRRTHGGERQALIGHHHSRGTMQDTPRYALNPPTSSSSCSPSTPPRPVPGSWSCTWRGPWRCDGHTACPVSPRRVKLSDSLSQTRPQRTGPPQIGPGLATGRPRIGREETPDRPRGARPRSPARSRIDPGCTSCLRHTLGKKWAR